jgi:hypothetical protein
MCLDHAWPDQGGGSYQPWGLEYPLCSRIFLLDYRPCSLLLSAERTVFFSHNKLTNSTFHGFSAKRTAHSKIYISVKDIYIYRIMVIAVVPIIHLLDPS